MPRKFSHKKRTGAKTSKLQRQVTKLQKWTPKEELKTAFLNNTGALTSTFSFNPLCDMKQGTANGTRTGNKITVVGITCNGIWYSESTTNTFSFCRGIIIVDRITQGTTPIAKEYLVDATSGIRTYNSPFDARCVSYKGRPGGPMNDKGSICYTIFKDQRKIVFPAQASNAVGTLSSCGTGPYAHQFGFKIKCRLPIIYDGNVGDITDQLRNSIHWGSMDSAGIANESSTVMIYYIDNV